MLIRTSYWGAYYSWRSSWGNWGGWDI